MTWRRRTYGHPVTDLMRLVLAYYCANNDKERRQVIVEYNRFFNGVLWFIRSDPIIIY